MKKLRLHSVARGKDETLAPVAGNGTWTAQFDGVSKECPDGLFSGTYEGSVKVGP